MSRWNHAICERCWINEKGTWEPAPEHGQDAVVLTEIGRPVLLKEPVLESAAFAGSRRSLVPTCGKTPVRRHVWGTTFLLLCRRR